MPTWSVVFGGLLTALGLLAYLQPETLGVGKGGEPPKPGQMSALSPAIVGALLVVSGLIALASAGARKHAMHLAAVVALLGTILGLVPVFLRRFAVEEVAVKVGLGMTLLSAVFLALCINSFVQARVLRKAGEQPPAA